MLLPVSHCTVPPPPPLLSLSRSLLPPIPSLLFPPISPISPLLSLPSSHLPSLLSLPPQPDADTYAMEQEMMARLVHHFKVDVPDQQYAVSDGQYGSMSVNSHCLIWS